MAVGTFYSNTTNEGKYNDYVGIVTALGGTSLEDGEVASRIGGFEEIKKIEEEIDEPIINESELSQEDLKIEVDKRKDVKTARKISAIFTTRNSEHDSYQNGTLWLKLGGKKGRQIDTLLPGNYQINSAMFRVKQVPMLVVGQGEVAVVKSYVGLAEKDISGKEFKFGSIVPVGHKGVWESTLRTGKYPLNPYCYEAVIVPTSIITLNFSGATSAHGLDEKLETITAKSNEGFEIRLQLVVQIHIPETEAPRIISSVGTLENLVVQVLKAAVDNYFRDAFQRNKAVDILNKRDEIQAEAFIHLKAKLAKYNKVELVEVLVEDVIYPEELTKVLKERQIAVQQKDTYIAEEAAQIQRASMQKEKGTADIQDKLSESLVKIQIAKNEAAARKQVGEGEASYTTQTGEARASAEKAFQLAQAAGLIAKTKALGPGLTAMVEVGKEFAKSQTGVPFMPRTLVTGGGSGGASEQGLITAAMQAFQGLSNFLPKESEEDEPIISTSETEPQAENGAKEETESAESGDVSKEETKEEPIEKSKEKPIDVLLFEDMSKTK